MNPVIGHSDVNSTDGYRRGASMTQTQRDQLREHLATASNEALALPPRYRAVCNALMLMAQAVSAQQVSKR